MNSSEHASFDSAFSSAQWTVLQRNNSKQVVHDFNFSTWQKIIILFLELSFLKKIFSTSSHILPVGLPHTDLPKIFPILSVKLRHAFLKGDKKTEIKEDKFIPKALGTHSLKKQVINGSTWRPLKDQLVNEINWGNPQLPPRRKVEMFQGKKGGTLVGLQG